MGHATDVWIRLDTSRNLEKNDSNRNSTVYCCVILRLVTSDGSDETQNDPGHPAMSWDDFPGA